MYQINNYEQECCNQVYIPIYIGTIGPTGSIGPTGPSSGGGTTGPIDLRVILVQLEIQDQQDHWRYR